MDPQYADVAWYSFAGMLLSQGLQAIGISADELHVLGMGARGYIVYIYRIHTVQQGLAHFCQPD